MARREADDAWRGGDHAAALALAWADHAADPDDQRTKALIAQVLQADPQLIAAEHEAALTGLLRDRDIDPGTLSNAGWWLVQRAGLLDGAPDAMAQKLEHHALALTLLQEDVVARAAAEAALSAVRHWLLLGGQRNEFPRLAEALCAQAVLNGGAWPFDADERAAIEAGDAFAAAYLPPRPKARAHAAFGDRVTEAVAAQYEGWPYPAWRRATRNKPTTLAALIRSIDPQGPQTIPQPAEILVAGCGTGRQVLQSAFRLPRDRITAIDISATSLDYARARCAEAGVHDVAFHQLDLHAVESLGKTFDAVMCAGVLHHLPDPEAGWAALTRVLKPGGVMHVMVYSRVARLRIAALRRSLRGLLDQPMSDDLLREIRRRVLAIPHPSAAPRSRDFASLAGVHDLLAHRHEDPFDVPRIRRALETLGLKLLCFDLPQQHQRVRYARENPQDPLRRDFALWAREELENPTIFTAMYDLWCRKAA